MAWRTWALLKERFKTLELIHCQNKIPKGGKPKPRGGECSPPPPERNPAYFTYMRLAINVIDGSGLNNESHHEFLEYKVMLY